jgi:hypothetical protein
MCAGARLNAGGSRIAFFFINLAEELLAIIVTKPVPFT